MKYLYLIIQIIKYFACSLVLLLHQNVGFCQEHNFTWIIKKTQYKNDIYILQDVTIPISAIIYIRFSKSKAK